jgi:hypothetical protein
MLSRDSDQVFCRSGHEFAERPTAFIWEGERLQIDELVARWRTPYGKRFLVRIDDNRIFTLIFFESSASWQVEQGDKPLFIEQNNLQRFPVDK